MSQNINIKLSSNVVQLSPGEGTLLVVTVTNIGRGVERLELSVNNIDPGWLLLDQTELLLYPDAPGNESTANLQISIPPTALAGSYSPTIDIRNAGDSVISASAPLVLIVNQLQVVSPEFHLLQESIQTSHKWGRFQLQMDNPLDQPQILKLYGRPSLPSTKMRIIPPVVEIPPRSQVISLIELEPAKRNRIRPPKRYDFMVAAENSPGQANGVLVQTPSIPFLARILASPLLLTLSILLPLLIVGAVAAFILWPRATAPTIAPQTVARCVPTYTAHTANLRMGELNTDIWVTDADTGQSRKIIQEPVERLPGIYSSLLSISPDGKQLAYVTAANQALDDAVIYVVNLSSSSKQRVAGIPAGYWPSHPIWSRDNNQLGYVVRNGAQLDFYVTHLTDKKQTVIPISQLGPDQFYGDPGVAGPLCFSDDNTRVILANKQSTTTQFEISLADKSAKEVSKPVAVISADKVFAPAAATAVEPPLAPLGDSACQVKTYSQNDPQWRDLIMKSRNENVNDKIGVAGCALTSASMMLNYYRVNTDPNELNACMGTDSNPINWSLPAIQCSDGFIAGVQRDYFSWDALNEQLKQGQPAIVGLLGGQTGVHFVVVVGGSDSIAATYRVNDPWDGTNYKSLAYFVNKGYQLQWLVSFKGANPPVCRPRYTAMATVDPTFKLKLSSPDDGHAYNQPVTINFTSGSDRTMATLNTVINSVATAPTSAAGQTGLTPGANVTIPTEKTQNQPTQNASQVVTNGDQVNGEGAYSLVINSPSDTGANQRLTANFIVDRTPPTLKRLHQGAFESDLSATGAQIAHGNVTMELDASDNLSGVAVVEYQVNGSPWQPYTNDVNSKPVIFTQAGEFTIVYRATDGAGNVTPLQEWKFAIVLTTGDVGTVPTGQGGVSGATPAATTPAATVPPANGDAGAGAVAGAGASDPASGGAGAPAPAPTTPALAPAVLAAAPAQLAFDATMENTVATIQLTNSGALPANFVIQPPTGPAAAYLKFPVPSGTVPAAGALPIQVQLSALNYGTAPVQGAFNIAYGGTVLQITFSVVPQPLPAVQFTSPASGPISKTVAIKLTANATGAAKPNHINLSAKYLDKMGGTVEERPLHGQVNAGNSWTYNWDIGALPPQEGIELAARLCWSADDSNCIKIEQGVAGLSIAKPTATITLDPPNPNLSGTVVINAAVSGPIDHITYSYSFKQNNADVVPILITEKANAGNQFKVTWNTAAIPPQPAGSPVKLNALVCWAPEDKPENCTAPISITPTPLTVEAPAIVATPLAEADAKNLPLQVALGGTVSKLFNPGATIWVDYKVIKTFGQPATDASAPATLAAPTNGTAIWSVNIDTSTFPPQTINFVPKVCWDGNRTGNYCYPVAVPLPGIIPELVPAFVDPKPADLSKEVAFKVSATPAGRATTVKFQISFTRFNKQLQDYTMLTTEANQENGFTINFNPVALGLAPNQPVNFKLVACNDSGYCSKATEPVPFQIPASTLTLSPAADTLTNLPPQVTLTGVVTGRDVGSLQLNAIYQDKRFAATGNYTKTTNYAGIAAGQPANTAPFPITWDTSDIPPQSNITLQYKLCWNGTLDNGCADPVVAYSGLTKGAPGVSKVILNGNLEYNPTNDQTKVLPIPYDNINTSTLGTIDLPITAVVTDTKISSIKWNLQGTPGGAAEGYNVELANVPVSNLTAVKTLKLNIADILNNGKAGANFNLVAYPVWQNVYTITDTAKIKTEPVKFVSMQVIMRGANTNNQIAPLTPPTAGQADQYNTNLLMVSRSTGISMTNFTSPDLVKRVLYDVSYNIGTATPQLNKPITTSAGAVKNGLPGSDFSIQWDHVSDLPKISPQGGIILGWRLCNTEVGDDSGCLPYNMGGSFNLVSGLTLAGIKYDPDPLSIRNNNRNSGIIDYDTHYFNSTFDAYVKVVGGSSVKAVRYIAYPTNATPESVKDKAVILNTRDVTAAQDGTWHSSVYWPTPDPTLGGTQSQANKLLNALGTNNFNMTVATQLCITATPDANVVDDTRCSDWTGVTQESIDSTYKAMVSGKFAVLVTWKPLTPCQSAPASPEIETDANCANPSLSTVSPYSQYVQDGQRAEVPTRTVTLKIYKVPTASATTSPTVYTANNSPVSIITGFSATNGVSGTIAGNSSSDIVSSNSVNGVATYFLQRPWNIRNLNLPVDAADTTTSRPRSVRLSVTVSFNIDSDGNPATPPDSFATTATVLTKGNDGYYSPPPAATTAAVAAGTTPAVTTAPSTSQPPATTAPPPG